MELNEQQFNLYMQIARKYAANLPDEKDRIKAFKWLKKINTTTDAKASRTKNHALSILIICLQRKSLVGPFKAGPKDDKALTTYKWSYQPSDIAKLILQQEFEKGGRPPISIEVSGNVCEFVAYQDIPDFGAQFFYAYSPEHIRKWENLDKSVIPRGLLNVTVVSSPDTSILARSLQPSKDPNAKEVCPGPDEGKDEDKTKGPCPKAAAGPCPKGPGGPCPKGPGKPCPKGAKRAAGPCPKGAAAGPCPKTSAAPEGEPSKAPSKTAIKGKRIIRKKTIKAKMPPLDDTRIEGPMNWVETKEEYEARKKSEMFAKMPAKLREKMQKQEKEKQERAAQAKQELLAKSAKSTKGAKMPTRKYKPGAAAAAAAAKEPRAARTPEIFRKGGKKPTRRYRPDEFLLGRDEKFVPAIQVFKYLEYQPPEDGRRSPVERRQVDICPGQPLLGQAEQGTPCTPCAGADAEDIVESFDRSYQKMMAQRKIKPQPPPDLTPRRKGLWDRLQQLKNQQLPRRLDFDESDVQVEPEDVAYERFVYTEFPDEDKPPSILESDGMGYDDVFGESGVAPADILPPAPALEELEKAERLLQDEMKTDDVLGKSKVANPDLVFEDIVVETEGADESGKTIKIRKRVLDIPGEEPLTETCFEETDEPIFDETLKDDGDYTPPLNDSVLNAILDKKLKELQPPFPKFPTPPRQYGPWATQFLEDVERLERGEDVDEVSQYQDPCELDQLSDVSTPQHFSSLVELGMSSYDPGNQLANMTPGRARKAGMSPTRLALAKSVKASVDFVEMRNRARALQGLSPLSESVDFPQTEEYLKYAGDMDMGEEITPQYYTPPPQTQYHTPPEDRSYMLDSEMDTDDMFGERAICEPSPVVEARSRAQTRRFEELKTKFEVGKARRIHRDRAQRIYDEQDLLDPYEYQSFPEAAWGPMDEPIPAGPLHTPLVKAPPSPQKGQPFESFERQLDESLKFFQPDDSFPQEGGPCAFPDYDFLERRIYEEEPAEESILDEGELMFDDIFGEEAIDEPCPMGDLPAPPCPSPPPPISASPLKHSHLYYMGTPPSRPRFRQKFTLERLEQESYPEDEILAAGTLEDDEDVCPEEASEQICPETVEDEFDPERELLDEEMMDTSSMFGEGAFTPPQRTRISPMKFARAMALQQTQQMHGLRNRVRALRGLSPLPPESCDYDYDQFFKDEEPDLMGPFGQYTEPPCGIIDEPIIEEGLPPPLIGTPQPRDPFESYERNIMDSILEDRIAAFGTPGDSILGYDEMDSDLFGEEMIAEPLPVKDIPMPPSPPVRTTPPKRVYSHLYDDRTPEMPLPLHRRVPTERIAEVSEPSYDSDLDLLYLGGDSDDAVDEDVLDHVLERFAKLRDRVPDKVVDDTDEELSIIDESAMALDDIFGADAVMSPSKMDSPTKALLVRSVAISKQFDEFRNRFRSVRGLPPEEPEDRSDPVHKLKDREQDLYDTILPCDIPDEPGGILDESISVDLPPALIRSPQKEDPFGSFERGLMDSYIRGLEAQQRAKEDSYGIMRDSEMYEEFPDAWLLDDTPEKQEMPKFSTPAPRVAQREPCELAVRGPLPFEDISEEPCAEEFAESGRYAGQPRLSAESFPFVESGEYAEPMEQSRLSSQFFSGMDPCQQEMLSAESFPEDYFVDSDELDPDARLARLTPRRAQEKYGMSPTRLALVKSVAASEKFVDIRNRTRALKGLPPLEEAVDYPQLGQYLQYNEDMYDRHGHVSFPATEPHLLDMSIKEQVCPALLPARQDPFASFEREMDEHPSRFFDDQSSELSILGDDEMEEDIFESGMIEEPTEIGLIPMPPPQEEQLARMSFPSYDETPPPPSPPLYSHLFNISPPYRRPVRGALPAERLYEESFPSEYGSDYEPVCPAPITPQQPSPIYSPVTPGIPTQLALQLAKGVAQSQRIEDFKTKFEVSKARRIQRTGQREPYMYDTPPPRAGALDDLLSPTEFGDFGGQKTLLDESIPGGMYQTPLVEPPTPPPSDLLQFDDSLGPLDHIPDSPGGFNIKEVCPGYYVPERDKDKQRFEEFQKKYVADQYGMDPADISGGMLADITPPFAPRQPCPRVQFKSPSRSPPCVPCEDFSPERSPQLSFTTPVRQRTPLRPILSLRTRLLEGPPSGGRPSRSPVPPSPKTPPGIGGPQTLEDRFQAIASGAPQRLPIGMDPATRIRRLLAQTPRFEVEALPGKTGFSPTEYVTKMLPPAEDRLEAEQFPYEALPCDEIYDTERFGDLYHALYIPSAQEEQEMQQMQAERAEEAAALDSMICPSGPPEGVPSGRPRPPPISVPDISPGQEGFKWLPNYIPFEKQVRGQKYIPPPEQKEQAPCPKVCKPPPGKRKPVKRTGAPQVKAPQVKDDKKKISKKQLEAASRLAQPKVPKQKPVRPTFEEPKKTISKLQMKASVARLSQMKKPPQKESIRPPPTPKKTISKAKLTQSLARLSKPKGPPPPKLPVRPSRAPPKRAGAPPTCPPGRQTGPRAQQAGPPGQRPGPLRRQPGPRGQQAGPSGQRPCPPGRQAGPCPRRAGPPAQQAGPCPRKGGPAAQRPGPSTGQPCPQQPSPVAQELSPYDVKRVPNVQAKIQSVLQGGPVPIITDRNATGAPTQGPRIYMPAEAILEREKRLMEREAMLRKQQAASQRPTKDGGPKKPIRPAKTISKVDVQSASRLAEPKPLSPILEVSASLKRKPPKGAVPPKTPCPLERRGGPAATPVRRPGPAATPVRRPGPAATPVRRPGPAGPPVQQSARGMQPPACTPGKPRYLPTPERGSRQPMQPPAAPTKKRGPAPPIRPIPLAARQPMYPPAAPPPPQQVCPIVKPSPRLPPSAPVVRPRPVPLPLEGEILPVLEGGPVPVVTTRDAANVPSGPRIYMPAEAILERQQRLKAKAAAEQAAQARQRPIVPRSGNVQAGRACPRAPTEKKTTSVTSVTVGGRTVAKKGGPSGLSRR